MFKRVFAVIMVVMSVFLAGIAIASPNMQEGKWEVTTKTEMEGMPMAMPPVTNIVCLTKKDLVPQKPEKDQDCKMIENRVVGDTVFWTMQCRSKEGMMETRGKITYKNNTYEGAFTTTVTEGGQKYNIKSNITGRRIGDCK